MVIVYLTYMWLACSVQNVKIDHFVVHYCVESVNFLQSRIVFPDIPASYKSDNQCCKKELNSQKKIEKYNNASKMYNVSKNIEIMYVERDIYMFIDSKNFPSTQSV